MDIQEAYKADIELDSDNYQVEMENIELFLKQNAQLK